MIGLDTGGGGISAPSNATSGSRTNTGAVNIAPALGGGLKKEAAALLALGLVVAALVLRGGKK